MLGKPVYFVFNVTSDLTDPQARERFLTDPRQFFSEKEMEAKKKSLETAVRQCLHRRQIRFYWLHAQAAFLASRTPAEAEACVLAKNSQLEHLISSLEEEVIKRGPIRRLQTVIDGTVCSLMDLQTNLSFQAKNIKMLIDHLEELLKILSTRLSDAVSESMNEFQTKTDSFLAGSLRQIGSLAETYFNRDLAWIWMSGLEQLDIKGFLTGCQKEIIARLQKVTADFWQNINQQSYASAALYPDNLDSFDSLGFKRSLQWPREIQGIMAEVSEIRTEFGKAGLWNLENLIPVASGQPIVPSFLFQDSPQDEMPARIEAARAALESHLEKLNTALVKFLKKWLYINAVKGLLHSQFMGEPKNFFAVLKSMGRAAADTQKEIGGLAETLNRDLLKKTAGLLGLDAGDNSIGRLVRDPGIQTKFLWAGESCQDTFTQAVGKIIGEWIMSIEPAPPEDQIAKALHPADVRPENVEKKTAAFYVSLPPDQIPKAMGRSGSNVRLASILFKSYIKIK
jgi:hypothetical protein